MAMPWKAPPLQNTLRRRIWHVKTPCNGAKYTVVGRDDLTTYEQPGLKHYQGKDLFKSRLDEAMSKICLCPGNRMMLPAAPSAQVSASPAITICLHSQEADSSPQVKAAGNK